MRLIHIFHLALCGAQGIANSILSSDNQTVNQNWSHARDATITRSDKAGTGCDIYKTYHGDGSISNGWPGITDWVSFEDMFTSNAELMRVSCPRLGISDTYSTTAEEVQHIRTAIRRSSAISGLDHRFVLAIMMQESLGCVRVSTTTNAIENPGLMQDHAGTASCNIYGTLIQPCPASVIDEMIDEGVRGTSSGDGLAQALEMVVDVAAGHEGAQMYYRAARLYNSGSIDFEDLGVAYASTRCYVSDIANRLTGWVWAEKVCDLS